MHYVGYLYLKEINNFYTLSINYIMLASYHFRIILKTNRCQIDLYKKSRDGKNEIIVAKLCLRK